MGLIFLCLFLSCISVQAQEKGKTTGDGPRHKQNLRGQVLDRETQSPMPGAKVLVLQDSTLVGGAITPWLALRFFRRFSGHFEDFL